MAITYPGAAYRQLAGKSTTLLSPRVINVHTMVWWLSACEDYFAQAGKPYSHFGTGYDGEVRQWQDLQFRAASDYQGNPFCISIENADKGVGFPAWTGSDVPRFTPAQAEALAQLIAWLCVRFNIPPVLLNDSLPGRIGPSYHRLGIDPWRIDGGVLYSAAYGKVCPGDRRIAQLRDEIMPRVVQIIGGTPQPQPEDDMPVVSHARDPRNDAIWEIVNFSTRRWLSSPRQVDISLIYWDSKNVNVDFGNWSPEDIDDKGIVPGTPVPAEGVTEKMRTATNEDVAWVGNVKVGEVKTDTEAILAALEEPPTPPSS